MLPSVEAALKPSERYKKFGEPGHVMVGSFDGDNTAYQMLMEGYLDADGVQDLPLEAVKSVEAIQDLRSGKTVPQFIYDNGFMVTQENLKETGPKMWGAKFKQP